jgi:CRP-like cAMP-binding protein
MTVMETRTYARFARGNEMNRVESGAGSPFHQRWSLLSASSQEVSPSITLFRQGNPPREVFYLERGLVKIIHLNENGQESAIGLQSRGSLLGAASVIVQKPYPFSAITVTTCALSRIPAEIFLHLAKTDEQFCWYLHEVHSYEVHQQASQLAAFRYLSARKRLERLLLQLLSTIYIHDKQTSIKIRLPLKHWEIAQLIGVSPEHLSRILQQIKQEGLLHEEDGCMVVSDVRKLSRQDDCD